MAALGYDKITVDAWGNVLGERRGSRPGPTLMLEAHMDVVPAPEPESWQHPPFAADSDGTRLWGRGAADTKGSLAAIVQAAGKMRAEEIRGRVLVLASVCEETLTGAAVGQVLDREAVDCFITGEPTSLRPGIAQKGRYSIQLEAHGHSAHTSRPELGDNAIYKMIRAVELLRALPRPEDPELGRGLLELTEMVSEPLPGTTCVPHGCRARMIGRTLPEEPLPQVLETLRAALAALEGLSLEPAVLEQQTWTGERLKMADLLPGWRTPAGDEWSERLLAGIAAAGIEAQRWAAPCGTNASAAAARGIPAFIFGPGSLEQAHTVDEWVDVTELVKAEEAFRKITIYILAIHR